MPSCTRPLTLGARASPLSQRQVAEVIEQLGLPEKRCSFVPFQTRGDRDQKTSLKTLPRDDFFTREIDEALLCGDIRAAIHSAKDLPIPLPPGLQIVALTEGLDARDALVLRKGETIGSLPPNARIATSSARRETLIEVLRSDFESVDIRGTIDKRLSLLARGRVDGIIMALCALERLGDRDYTIIPLEGTGARYQGRLAVLARADDSKMRALFAPIDTKKTLSFGLRPKNKKGLSCQPLIETIPLAPSLDGLGAATHILLSSQSSLDYLAPYLSDAILKKELISIGQKTSEQAARLGFQTIHTARDETSEGVTALLGTLDLGGAHLFWPHSALSRRIIPNWLFEKRISFSECALYTTRNKKNVERLPLDQFDELFFSSPSTVDAFFELYGRPPEDMLVRTQGATTYSYFKEKNSL